jgi:serine/threonine protein kinase
MEPLFPAEIPDRYRPRAILGRGAMGTVYLAEDAELGRTVAIKVMTHQGLPAAVARFRREAQVLAGIRHPHLVEVYGFGEAGRDRYLVMEHLEGAPLHRTAPPHDLAQIAVAVGGALAALHRAGVVHRDVKPANIFRTDDGRVVLMDLGLVYDPNRTRLTQKSYLVGSLCFLSPEALLLEDPTEAQDWWALGVTLFLLAEGRQPFEFEALTGITKGQPLPAPVFRMLPEGAPLRRLVEGLLRFDRGRRLQGMSAIRRLLQPRAPRRSRSLRGPLTASVTLGLAALVGGLVLRPSGPPRVPAPSHRTPVERETKELLAPVREQYFALETSPAKRSILAPDPANWSQVLQGCPALAPPLDEAAALLDPRRHPPDIGQGMARVDEFFEGQGFDPPYLAIRTTRPTTQPIPPPLLLSRGGFRPSPPQPAAGWLGRAFLAASRIEAGRQRLEAERASSPGQVDLPDFVRYPAFRVLELDRVLGHARAHPDHRRAAHAWTRPEVDEYRRLLLALDRAVHTNEPDALALTPVLLDSTRWLLPASLVQAAPRWILGAPDDTLARRLLVAMVRRRLLHVARDISGLTPSTEAARLLRELSTLRSLAATSRAPALLGPVAWVEALEVHRGLEQHAEALELMRSIEPPPWTWEDDSAAWGVLRAWGLLNRERGDGIRPDEATQAGVRSFADRWEASGHPRSGSLLRDFGMAPARTP